MSTNGANTSEDAEMAECESEKVVTMMDVLKEQEDFEEDANAVLGASDDKECTYSKGYIKRQAIYACMTCCAEARNDPTKRAGVCLACSLNCHENHELIELYTKRNFRCDCGNPKFNGHPCQFTPDKTEVNEDNVYNQNFSGVYCTCHRPYPDPESTVEQEMIQCIICEDWLHASHLEAVVPGNEQYAEMICKACMDKNEFLHDYSHLAVNKDNVDVDILNTSSELSDAKCNGCSSMKEDGDTQAKEKMDMTENSNINDISKEQINMEVESTKVADEIKVSEQQLSESGQQVPEISSDDQSHKKQEVTSTESINSDENKDNIEKKDSESEIPVAKESSGEENLSNKNEEIGTKTLESNDDINKKQDITENNVQSDSLIPEESSDKQTDSNDVDDENVHEKADVENKESTRTLVTDESSDVQMHSSNEEKDCVTNDKQDSIVNEDTTQPDKLQTEQKDDEQTQEIKSSSDSNQETNETKEESQSSLPDEKSIPSENTEKPDNRTQEQVEEDLLLRDPVESDQGHDETKNAADITSNNETNCASSNETENKSEPEAMDTSDPKVSLEDKENSEKGPEITSTAEQTTAITEDQAKNSEENPTDVVVDESSTHKPENEESIKKDDDKDNSNAESEVSDKTATADILKRKLSSEVDNDDSITKKPKLNETQCARPKGVKKIHKGATFWPSNFRHKLCTCNECLSMYKDLSVLFLTDPEDTVTAYEKLGQEKTGGEHLSQYEKGMAALSSLGRVQQINALTEYTKMRDKLLDFLKSFKDRKVIVKEEDIKAFFAGMKPVREPDGVYFCR
ncbi:uncharacterized protein [Epargyreus clarus]|uniref:uncharacterized protein n=1 Tax=Epargyreus clarus TaxID=520877 RepID=UPI003C2CB544